MTDDALLNGDANDEALAALDAYVEALLDGEPVDREALLEKHPELADELALVTSLHDAADSVALDATGDDSAPDEGSSGIERLLPPGTRLGECVLEELIGAGGMGEVYRAKHEVLGRDVAVKVLRPSLVDEPDAVERFRREVQAQASIGAHPNVVTALHASQHDGRLYLVMEDVRGENLTQLVRREGPLHARRALALIRQAALGLAHAHRAGIIHRDIKPSNLLVTDDGVVKVVDLGLASLAVREPSDDDDDRRRWVDELVGSLDYMAPEQAKHPDHADARSDLYALGCTLYFLLEGRAPFADRLALKKLMAHAVEAPAAIERDVPQPIQRVLASLLEKEPAARPESAEALVTAIDRAIDTEPPRASRGTAVPPPATTSPGPWRSIAIGTGAVAVACLLALGFVLLTDRAPRLEVESAVVGQLDSSDPVRPKERSYFETHRVAVTEGQTYVWTLRTRDFDPVLLLRVDDWEVDSNDDAPGFGISAQLVWTADRTGEVEVVATAFREGAEGSYVLAMQRLERPELTLGEALGGELDATDDHLYADRSLVDRYWMRVTAGETYVLRMRAEGFTPHILLESDQRSILATSRLASDDATEARLVYIAQQPGVVFVGANTVTPGESGSYALSAASELVGETVLEQTGRLAEGDETLGDDSWVDPYSLPVRAGFTYVISLTSEDFDTYLLLEDDSGKRVAQNDDADGTDSRIVFTARSDRPMTIQANSYSAGMQGEYTLSVLELAP